MDVAGWDDLPKEEHQFVWDEAESKFWRDFNTVQETRHSSAEHEYLKVLTEVKVEIGTLDGKRDQLNRSRERLAQELRNVEAELACVAAECDEKATRLTTLEREYRQGELERLEQRENVARTMIRWFREKRGNDVPAEPGDGFVNPANGRSQSKENGARPMEGVRYASDAAPEKPAPMLAAPKAPILSAALPAKMAPLASAGPSPPLVDIVDADGRVIGPVERIEPWNQWVKAIQDMPVQRPVKIRRGRKFNQDHLAGIYERCEAKGVKWLSCMIQSIGEIQGQRCLSCDKNQGAFDDCIIVGGPLFQKCGNCEWNRQGCHGAALRKTNHAEPTLVEEEADKYQAAQAAQDDAQLRARNRQAAQEALAKAAGLAQDTAAMPASEPVQSIRSDLSKEKREASQAPHEQPLAPCPEQPRAYVLASGFTPANIPSRTPSRGLLTPTAHSLEPSPQPTESQGQQEELPEITRETLVQRHNGKEYTYPEVLEGVPLEKIDENHPYWDPRWPNIRALIEPPLQQWQEKYQAALGAREKGERGSARFQLGRQVNRGLKIIEFLDEGEISPYQLLGKNYTHAGKGSITSYDTLFRLCETLSELAKYRLDMPPVDWMRQRLHELWLEQGSAFNVSKIIHNFYNDAKLSTLRAKAGFKNIGRPSGPRTSRAGLGGTPNGGTPQAQPKKRKSRHSLAGTPMDRDTSSLEESPPAQRHVSIMPQSPSNMQANKRPKLQSPTPQPAHQGLDVAAAADDAAADADAEFTDADSWSRALTGENRFRIYQIKSRLYTSSTQATQYLHWVEDARRFEHRFLKELDPVSWGGHGEPADFNIRLDDMAEVVWSAQALHVHLAVREQSAHVSGKDGQPRGDVLVAFKRLKTVRRFVKLCQELGLRVDGVPLEDMDSRWALLQSERSSVGDEEGSSEESRE